MPALQNKIYRKVRNSFLHKVEPKKGYKKPHAIEACKHFNNWRSMENSCYN